MKISQRTKSILLKKFIFFYVVVELRLQLINLIGHWMSLFTHRQSLSLFFFFFSTWFGQKPLEAASGAEISSLFPISNLPSLGKTASPELFSSGCLSPCSNLDGAQCVFLSPFLLLEKFSFANTNKGYLAVHPERGTRVHAEL